MIAKLTLYKQLSMTGLSAAQHMQKRYILYKININKRMHMQQEVYRGYIIYIIIMRTCHDPAKCKAILLSCRRSKKCAHLRNGTPIKAVDCTKYLKYV